jgi:hypothetical protein
MGGKGEGWEKTVGERGQNELLERGAMGFSKRRMESEGGESRDERMVMVKLIV